MTLPRRRTASFACTLRYSAMAVLAAACIAFTGPGGVTAASPTLVIISEVHPAGSGNGTYSADWFEITNTGTLPVDLTGWKMDDNSNSFANAVPLRGVTSLPGGASAIFFENSAAGVADATIAANFSMAWFGTATPPAGMLIGAYGGSGVGLGTGGDAVNLFDASGTRVTGIGFGAATANATFDNTTGAGSTTLPLPIVTRISSAGVNGAFLSFNGAETGSPGRRLNATPLSSIDLSTYVRVGRFDLPEPTRTPAPPNSLLAQEASAVTYDWDTDTLFVVGDGGTSVVQVTKTGDLIDSMTLAPGGSPQGTEFYDTEGLTYVGAGKFVLMEERDRQAVLFTYVPGATLTRSATKTVKLGTFAPNIGIEGISYDPLTAGFFAVKETGPQGIFQTGIDFAAGTATNGSPTTENSINLFDPALANLLDFADVFALSNLSSLSGPQSTHLLILSQESGKIVDIDRTGVISSSLTIRTDPGNPLAVPAQQHEGLTMDGNGYLYVVSENGGGDIDHPQLWVYAPSTVPNQPPAHLTLGNVVTTIAENTSTAAPIKVADIVIDDDELGTNILSVTGSDAAFFSADSTGLYIKAGTVLDFETKSSYSVTVAVDDPTVGATPDATAAYTLTLTDVVEAPPASTVIISEVAPWGSGNTPYAADWFEITNTGTVAVNIAGWKMDDNSNSFAASVALNGVTSIGPGESVIFLESANAATTKAAFLSAWFGAAPPAALQIGTYTGSGVGLSTGGDAVNIYNAAGTVQASVTFGASPSAAPFASFDNAAGIDNAAISQLSAAGVHGGFVARGDANEIGSPGAIANPLPPPGRLIISEVAPWSSGSSPVAADWFEVTNVGAGPVDITGWKVDDNSESPVAAVALNGIGSIAPGESVIFIETADLATAKAAFLNAWFGGRVPATLRIGSYSGSGVGLSTGGDAVNLYNASGVLQAKVFFGASPANAPFSTFDNAAGLNDAAITQLAAAGARGAFVAADGIEVGSPGSIAADRTPPTIHTSADIVVSAVDASGAIVAYATPLALDDVDLNIVATCTPLSGTLFPLGSTTVTCTASDAAGNAATPRTFAVNVVDRTPPLVTPPANVLTSTAGQTAIVTFAASAIDNVSTRDRIAIACQPPSGSAFSIGTTEVTCTAVDEAGNASTPAMFTVTVNAAPVAVPDSAATLEAVPVSVSVLANDSDREGDAFAIVGVTQPGHGTAAIAASSIRYTPAADFYGNDTFTYMIADARGGTATTTVTVSVSRLGRFVALSRDLTWMRAGATAISGDVGAIDRRHADHRGDRDGDDGDRDDVTVRMGAGAAMNQRSSRVVGDAVLLQSRSSVYDLVDNFLLAKRNSTVLGTVTTPMVVPFVPLPAFPEVQAGAQKVVVAKGRSSTLVPGSYGSIQVGAGATLVLTGGLYQVDSIDLAESATLMFRAQTELRVRTELDSRSKARIIVDPAVSGLSASQVVIYVAGRDEDCRRTESDDDGDDAGPVTVHIGSQSVVQANIYAARGTVWLKSKTRATGAFIGMHVRVGVNVQLTLDSAFR